MSPMMIENENDVEVGESLPPMTEHVSQNYTAIPVEHLLNTPGSLPTWRANVGYEEGEEWVISKMKTGYPRYVIGKWRCDLY
jgi:cystathionine gamma-synthase